jgi:GNAT superfamily N-acetyltransferase
VTTRVAVRIAELGDAPVIEALLDYIDELHRAALPRILQQTDEPRPAEFLGRFLTQAGCVALVALVDVDPEPVGVLLACVREVAADPIVIRTRVAEIDTIVVTPLRRRQGIALALVGAAMEWARANGATRVELGVYEFNQAARAFWQSGGFETLSRRLEKPIP